MTLYYFAKDVNGKSNAAGAVLQTWPVFNTATFNVPSSLAASDFSTITRPDGLPQTAYKGWPLYFFANDKAPGDTNGDGVGGVWFLVKVPFYTVLLQNRTDFGNYLADPKGMTLYYNNKDSAGTSTVSGATLANWPIFNAASFNVPSALNASDFGTITRSDGQKQSTYKGFPLYYYVNDKTSGDALGNGLGGVWFVISTTNFPPSPTPAPQQPSGGY
jgi:predicted lipoprotein with Yx(FWY)xxD motif